METIQRYYQVERSDIGFLKFILEAYDGIAMMRTIDPPNGIVALHIAPDCVDDVEYVLQDLNKQIQIQPYAMPENLTRGI